MLVEPGGRPDAAPLLPPLEGEKKMKDGGRLEREEGGDYLVNLRLPVLRHQYRDLRQEREGCDGLQLREDKAHDQSAVVELPVRAEDGGVVVTGTIHNLLQISPQRLEVILGGDGGKHLDSHGDLVADGMPEEEVPLIIIMFCF